MASYRYDLHVHTRESSPCGRVPARRVAELYHEIGYAGIAITDHYTEGFFSGPIGRRPWEERIERFLAGYRAAAERGRELGLRVFLGLELRFVNDTNDYLVYGADEEFLKAHPELTALGLERFRELAAGKGLLVYQAHPFRPEVKPADPRLLDGVEVYNGNPRHDSRNHLALQFARAHGLRMISGSDFHQLEDLGRGGIEVEEEIATGEELVAVLRHRRIKDLIGLEEECARPRG